MATNIFLYIHSFTGCSHGRETVQLRHMWEMFQQHGQPEQTPAHPHWREAVHLQYMRTQLQSRQQPKSPPADTHRWETVYVRQVREELLLHEEPEGPQVFLRLKLQCHEALWPTDGHLKNKPTVVSVISWTCQIWLFHPTGTKDLQKA